LQQVVGRVMGAILLATVVLAGGIASAVPASASTGIDSERYAFCKMNEERRARGLAPLAWDGAIADTSRSWSRHMASVDRLYHDPNLGSTLFALVPGANLAAENVGVTGGTDEGLHDAFMRSDGHRANILRASANRVGVGATRDARGRLWITHRFVAGPAIANPDTCAEGSAAAANPGKTPFRDVPGGAYYEDAVLWAVDRKVTTGTTSTTFSPNAPVTRAQMGAFLWRSEGRPAPTAARFSDVPTGTYYTDATSWMRGAGMRAACATDRYCPSITAARADIVMWLWQAAGSPDHGTDHGFSDVPAGAYYERAVTWAKATGVTNGATATTFAPMSSVTRAQSVTFLWRAS
jgi:uncharacterized protein YkwD